MRNWINGGGFLLLFPVAFSAWSGAAQEQASSVSEGQVLADGAVGAVFGLVAVDYDLRSQRQCILSKAQPQQCIGAAAFHSPVDHFAVGAGHVNVNPGVRIDEPDLGDFAAQL